MSNPSIQQSINGGTRTKENQFKIETFNRKQQTNQKSTMNFKLFTVFLAVIFLGLAFGGAKTSVSGKFAIYILLIKKVEFNWKINFIF